MNDEINISIDKYKREKWKEKVEEIDAKTNSTKLYKLIKFLNGKNNGSAGNEGIKFKGKYISNPSNIANSFNKQYTSVVKHSSSKETRKISKSIRKNNLSDSPKYTSSQTKDAIKKSKASKAIGPDGISNLHLKHIGPKGLEFLTQIYNLSLETCQIPTIWKSSIIIPLPKPGKDLSESKSFRPVSILCPGIKILERLVLPVLTEKLPVPSFQHGFRKSHSTVSALSDLNEAVIGGFNAPRPAPRTLLLQIDLSKAFDMVNHNKLIKDLNESDLPPVHKRWLNCYLRGRQSRVKFRGKTSSSRNVKAGVPQGAVTSPLLFNFYLSKLPTPPDGIHILQYADDISIYCSGLNIDDMAVRITEYMKKVTEYLEERDLTVSPEKSTTTLFTPSTHEFKAEPEVYIKGEKVNLDRRPKLLGLVFDTMYSFTPHIDSAVSRAKSKLGILKALAGSSWGQDKETMITTYKTICRSTLEYGNQIWSPIIEESNWLKLQRVQSKALRIATGCLQMSSDSHLHQESKVLPVKDHCIMLGKQYVAACHQPGHPGQKNLQNLAGRNMKSSVMHNSNYITNLFADPTEVDSKSYKSVLKEIHTTSVSETIQSYPTNRVLGCIPPSISKEEKRLPRATRTELARLRSGFSRNLNSYMSRIDDTVDDRCPSCRHSPHDTLHLFNCTSNPTQLNVIDLWKKPVQTANFLGMDMRTSDDDPP